jgi:hypothetical protein
MARKKQTREEKQAKEHAREQMAFTEILETMRDIARDEVNHAMLNWWRSKLNILRDRGRTIKLKDMLACSEMTDPFNVEAQSCQDLANWFVQQWRRLKPGASSVHVRGLHYAIATLADTPDAIRLPNGKLYENTDQCWETLQRAGKYARYLGLLNPDIFEDRRSREPVVKEFKTSSRSLYVFNHSYVLDDFELKNFPEFPEFSTFPDLPELPYYSLHLRGQQRYRLEVWIEKSTQEKVLQRICDKYEVTSVQAQGEISISAMWKGVKRAQQYGNYGQTTTVILYISDFDPAGKSMPVAAARKLEFLRKLRRTNVKMRLYPIALTYEQCVQYQLPRTPIKDSDSRKSSFEGRYGVGATELDALESLHEGELAKIVERAILRFRDPSIHNKVYARQREIEEELDEIHGK